MVSLYPGGERRPNIVTVPCHPILPAKAASSCFPACSLKVAFGSSACPSLPQHPPAPARYITAPSYTNGDP